MHIYIYIHTYVFTYVYTFVIYIYIYIYVDEVSGIFRDTLGFHCDVPGLICWFHGGFLFSGGTTKTASLWENGWCTISNNEVHHVHPKMTPLKWKFDEIRYEKACILIKTNVSGVPHFWTSKLIALGLGQWLYFNHFLPLVFRMILQLDEMFEYVWDKCQPPTCQMWQWKTQN